MFKKLFTILLTATSIMALTACRREAEPDVEYVPEEYIPYVPAAPTEDDLRAQFEVFFNDNRDRIIREIATGGEEVHLELGDSYEFLLTIVLDDIELDDENRNLYALTFGLFFPEMADFFEGIANGILRDAGIDHFRLTAIFADMNGEEIARSRFDAVPESE